MGKVGPYNEQGNWYRGGAVQMLFIDWLYGEQNQVRPMFPKIRRRQDLIQASKMFDLAPQMPPVDWAKAFEHLPEKDIISAVGGPRAFSPTRCRTPPAGHDRAHAERPGMAQRRHLAIDTMPINVPGFWFMTWYDVSTGPNLAAYNFVRATAKGEAANEQYAVIAPTLHCGYTRANEHTVVGERDMGDARLDYDALTYAWFDHFLKGEDNGFLEKQAQGQYYTMGANKWQHSDTWPPRRREAVTLLSDERGPCQHTAWRRRACAGDSRLRLPAPTASLTSRKPICRILHVRPDAPDAELWRQRLLRGEYDSRQRRSARPAQDGGASRHPCLHLRAA